MPDIQATPDTRGLAIDQVGVSDLRYPIQVLDHDGKPFPTVAKISMSVHLPHHFKGTHMSRFLEVLSKHEGEVTMRTLPEILHDLKKRLDAEEAHIEVAFTYFVTKKAPVSGSPAKVGCDVVFQGTSNGTVDDFVLCVTVPVTTLCPCSKEISEYGAHNQRSHITIAARVREHLWIEELIDIAESEASCELYGILKRPDEKFVTERAYDNPKFVEDIVRDVAGRLEREERVRAYVVEAENFESIHNHSAYALIERDKDPPAA